MIGDGFSKGQVARTLGVSTGVVNMLSALYLETENYSRRPRPDRQSATTDHQDHHLGNLTA